MKLILKRGRDGQVSSRFHESYIDQIDQKLSDGSITIKEAHRMYYDTLKPYINEDTLDSHWESYMNLFLSRIEVGE